VRKNIRGFIGTILILLGKLIEGSAATLTLFNGKTRRNIMTFE
jgi:hypothetical protein